MQMEDALSSVSAGVEVGLGARQMEQQPTCKDISFCVWSGIQYSYFSISLSPRSP